MRLTTCAKLLCPVASENDKPPHPESVAAVLAGKPLVAFAFDDMIMEVAEPEIVLGKVAGN